MGRRPWRAWGGRSGLQREGGSSGGRAGGGRAAGTGQPARVTTMPLRLPSRVQPPAHPAPLPATAACLTRWQRIRHLHCRHRVCNARRRDARDGHDVASHRPLQLDCRARQAAAENGPGFESSSTNVTPVTDHSSWTLHGGIEGRESRGSIEGQVAAVGTPTGTNGCLHYTNNRWDVRRVGPLHAREDISAPGPAQPPAP